MRVLLFLHLIIHIPDNGIKFFDGNGYKLPDEVEDQLEEYVRQSADNELPRPTGDGIGTCRV